MKKLTFALLLLIVVFGNACKKENNQSQANVSFKVDGTLKQASGDTKVTAMYFTSQKTLQFMGNLENNLGIGFAIQDYKGVGDYDVADFNVTASYVTDFGSTGIIKITTSTDKVVKGTFQFIVRDPVTNAIKFTITEGTFEVKVTAM
jgi:hypothetical protein